MSRPSTNSTYFEAFDLFRPVLGLFCVAFGPVLGTFGSIGGLSCLFLELLGLLEDSWVYFVEFWPVLGTFGSILGLFGLF